MILFKKKLMKFVINVLNWKYYLCLDMCYSFVVFNIFVLF